MMPVIYVDILLAVNLFVDYLLLTATARVLSTSCSQRRMIGGAAVGAISSLIILLPPLSPLLSVLYKGLTAAAMVRVTFRFEGWRGYLKQSGMLFLISALFAGVCFAAWWFLSPTGLTVQSGVVYYDVPPLWLLFLTTLSYGALCVFERLTRKRIAKGYRYRVEIIDGDQCVVLEAMPDSGHSLLDSFSGAPVVLVKEQAVRQLRNSYDPVTASGGRLKHIRYIPYQSIGGDGVLAAFRPHRVTLYADDRSLDISGVWVAPTTALRRPEYDALIGPAITDRLS